MMKKMGTPVSAGGRSFLHCCQRKFKGKLKRKICLPGPHPHLPAPMASVASSPSRLSEYLSTPPLDFLPHDPAVSSPPRFPRLATPWPHIPSAPNSSSILPSSPFDPDSLPPPSVSCHSLPNRRPISFLGVVPFTDFGFPSASPVHPSIRPEPLNSVAKLSPHPSSPPSFVPCAPEGAKIESACKACCPARPNFVVSLLKEESSFDASKSVIGCCGDECFSKHHCCPDGPSPISAGTPAVLLNIPEGLESESGLGVPLEPTPAESERYSEALPAVPPLKSGDSVTDSLCHSDAQASSPLGVSWASVVEKRAIGGKISSDVFLGRMESHDLRCWCCITARLWMQELNVLLDLDAGRNPGSLWTD